ncbi:tape measure protein [Rouxiella sp. Mn2063]|uniref:tape measure protein n=1 Tax=Rouxiella sp. Mn2063 TaxID=3395262 RepID=UPI003BCEE8EE
MSVQDGGKLTYEVEIETAKLLTGSRKASVVLEQMRKTAQSASGGFDSLDSSGRKASGSLNGVAGGAKSASDSMSVAGRGADALGGGFTKLSSLVKGYITIQAALKLIEIADDMTMLQARVTRLSASFAEAKETMASLSAIAANTGSSLAGTEKLWETLTSSLKEAGATNSQVLMLTDTLQKIGVVGGSSAEEMANALRQFGQSISGGIVRAEEFNSILEQMPELARQIAAGLGISIGDLRKKMLEGKLTAEDALNAIQKRAGDVNTEFDKMPVTVDRAKNSLDIAFKNMISDLNTSIQLTQTLAGLMQSVSNNLNFYNKNAGDAARMPKLVDLQKQYNDALKEGQQWYESDNVYQQRRGQAAFELKRVEQEIASIRAKSAKNAEDASKPIQIKSSTSDPKKDKLIEQSKRRVELSKLEGEARARLQAQYDAEDAGFNKEDPVVKTLQDRYAEYERNTKGQKASNAESKKSDAQAEAINQKLENYRQESELAADSIKNLTREQQLLKAAQSLGSAATDEQRKKAMEYKAAALDAADAAKGVAEAMKLIPEAAENKSYSESMKSLDAALKAGLIKKEQYDAAAENAEQEHQANLAKIRADSAVSPKQQSAGLVDPVQQLANENAQKLALIKQFEADKTITEQQGIALRNAANRQFEQQRVEAQYELWRQQSIGNEVAAAAFDSFAGNVSNSLTGIITGSMSASDAMRSLGATVLNSVINSFVQMGIEQAKAAIFGATVQQTQIAATTAVQTAAVGTQLAVTTSAAAATTAAWTPAAIMASIASMGTAAKIGLAAVAVLGVGALAGKRKNGGPVSADSLYEFGEGNLPEVLQMGGKSYMLPGNNGRVFSNDDVTGSPVIPKASTGKQYMVPGDNGKVISNKDMQAGGGGSPTIIVHNYSSSAGVQDYQMSKDSNGNDVLELAIADINNGGRLSQAISNNHQAPRRARGS